MIFIFCCIFLLFFSVGYSNPIAGGTNVGEIIEEGNVRMITGQTEFPFMAFLEIFETEYLRNGRSFQSIFRCGGVILSQIAVLTAAHCIGDPHPAIQQEIYVKAGIVHLDFEKGQVIKASKYVKHDRYIEEEPTKDDKLLFNVNDVSIVWLEMPLTFGPTVNNAVLAGSADSLSNASGLIIGWGRNGNGQIMNMLQKASMKVVSNAECIRVYHNIEFSINKVCLMYTGEPAASCDGDSGGPFVANGKVYAISSITSVRKVNGRELCDPTGPVIYTEVGAYEDWIKYELSKGSSDGTSSGIHSQFLTCGSKAKLHGLR